LARAAKDQVAVRAGAAARGIDGQSDRSWDTPLLVQHLFGIAEAPRVAAAVDDRPAHPRRA
jgi:hypothetical protein